MVNYTIGNWYQHHLAFLDGNEACDMWHVECFLTNGMIQYTLSIHKLDPEPIVVNEVKGTPTNGLKNMGNHSYFTLTAGDGATL